MTARTTQRDVALRAGVHRTTVSLALRNHPSIPLSTRRRIQSLARIMDYHPDPGLCALVAYRNAKRARKITSSIGYLTNWTSRWGWKSAPAHEEFYAGAVAKAKEHGFAIEHFWLGEPGQSLGRLADILEARGIRGLLVASHARPVDNVGDFPWPEFSAVKIDLLPGGLPLDYVTNDQRAIVMTAMRQAIGGGYRRIGFVLPQVWDDAVDLAWSSGYLAMQARLPEINRIPPLLYAADTVEAMNVPDAALSEWLRAGEPDLILGFGAFVLPVLRRIGVRVPKHVAFVDVLLQDGAGPIAGMRQNCARVGEMAVDVLAQHLTHNETGIPPVPVAVLVEGSWCDGPSMPTPRRRAEVPVCASAAG
jgi:LacI family transcriptional regulator